jgi:hypothetical protein
MKRTLMPKSQIESRICSSCQAKAIGDPEFCPHCGNSFADGLRCVKHKSSDAIGVCVVCCLPYCSRCASRVNKRYLCHKHEGYEIYEGMARVYGISDEAAARYVTDCLVKKGLHPFLYSRKASPISIGGSDYTLFEASGEFDGHIINEIKVMVPCGEVLAAEELLQKLDTKVGKRPVTKKGE